jgi:hypothetical protein
MNMIKNQTLPGLASCTGCMSTPLINTHIHKSSPSFCCRQYEKTSHCTYNIIKIRIIIGPTSSTIQAILLRDDSDICSIIFIIITDITAVQLAFKKTDSYDSEYDKKENSYSEDIFNGT